VNSEDRLPEDVAEGRPTDIGHHFSDFVGSIGAAITNHGKACPHAREIAEMLKKGDLLSGGSCGGRHPYNQVLLDEILRIHSDLKEMQSRARGGSVLRQAGGGYNKDTGAGGINVPIKAGNLTLFAGNPNSPSYCSSALFTVFTRTVGRIDNGAIFAKMSASQLRNFKWGQRSIITA
jgi:hypothetical protein